MNNKKIKYGFIVATSSSILILLDWFSKKYALEFWPEKTVLNTGIAFSIPIPNILMIVLTPLLIGYASHIIIKQIGANKSSLAICSLLISGGLGNLFDRLIRGGVVDFISIWIWPSFNFADIYLTSAAFLLILNYGKITRTNKT